jgi:hypothetical protein
MIAKTTHTTATHARQEMVKTPAIIASPHMLATSQVVAGAGVPVNARAATPKRKKRVSITVLMPTTAQHPHQILVIIVPPSKVKKSRGVRHQTLLDSLDFKIEQEEEVQSGSILPSSVFHLFPLLRKIIDHMQGPQICKEARLQ